MATGWRIHCRNTKFCDMMSSTGHFYLNINLDDKSHFSHSDLVKNLEFVRVVEVPNQNPIQSCSDYPCVLES